MKKIISLLLLIIIILSQNVYAISFPKINSKIIEVYDMTDDTVLYEIDSTKRASIASLTKIAATITAIENIDDLNKKVTITKEILDTVDKEASMAKLKEGDVLTYKELLYAVLIPSGADAVHTIAITRFGSLDNFVAEMNKLAQKIGLTDTHFENAIGLYDKNHYSTADDVRKVLVYALKNPVFREIYTTKEYRLSTGLLMKSTIYMYNTSQEDIDKVLGNKTGHIEDSGFCFTSLSNANGHEIVIVTLKGEHIGQVYYNVKDNVDMIDFLNENYEDRVLLKKDDVIKSIPVSIGNIDSYDITTSSDITKFLPSDYDKNKFKVEYEGLEELDYHNKKGDKIGTIKCYYDNELFKSDDVILDKDIRFSFFKYLKKNFILSFLIVLVIIFFYIRLKKKRQLAKKRRR